MKRKPKAEVHITCSLCDHFFHSPLNKNNQVHNPRQCRSEDMEIHSTDKACDNFIMAQYFFCDNTSHQINAEVCAKRRARKWEECNKCRQHIAVELALATGSTPPVLERPQLKARVRSTGHPSLPGASVQVKRIVEPETRRILKRRVIATE